MYSIGCSQRWTYRRRPTVLLTVITLILTIQIDLRGGYAVPALARPRTSSGSAPDLADSDDEDTADALDQLTRVFGVKRVTDYYGQRRPPHFDEETAGHSVRLRHHRSPPEYMVHLYDTIAYADGISKTAAPYEADVVRGIPDRGIQTQRFIGWFRIIYGQI